jgi:hypothetical protein
MTARQAYSSTVVAPVPAGLSVAFAAAVVAVAVAGAAPLWLGAVVGLVVLAAGGYLATVRLAVGGGRIVLGQGPCGRGRVIDTARVAETGASVLTWPQAFGIGLPFARRTTRLTVRPGPTLRLRLDDGEVIRVSTADPGAARRLIITDEEEPQ